MKNLILLLLFILPLCALAQIKYEAGYFINNENTRTQCLIYNVDWLNNPTDFKYKLKETDETLVATIGEVQEFGVGNIKYTRATVKMDTSIQAIKALRENRNPEWSERTLFLKVLVDGKAKLYYYRSPVFIRFDRFFFSVDGEPIEQLVFKEYLQPTNSNSSTNYRPTVSKDPTLGVNSMYLQQLRNKVACGEVDLARLKKVKYDRDGLVKHFNAFNVCHGEVVTAQPKGTKFHLTVTPGIDYGQFSLYSINSFGKKNRGNLVERSPKEIAYRLGLMMEMVLPFHHNRWSIPVEPTFQSFKSGDLVTYSSLEIPIGLRHYVFFGSKSSVFINGLLVPDIPFTYEATRMHSTYVGSRLSFCSAAGVGFKWNRLSLEGRHYFDRSSVSGLLLSYNKSSLILGYRIK